MAENTLQRAYRAPCPGCGAPVAFLSAQSTHAVCGYCHSTVVREGEVLKRLGKMAELFDDHSLLQLGAAGKIDGQAFTLIGRLQYKYDEGTWTEWVALFDDGRTASLSEDNGAYVFSREFKPQHEIPAADQFRVGDITAIDGQSYAVASRATAALVAAQGELPHLPPLGQPFSIVELRGRDTHQVVSIDYGPTLAGQPPELFRGQAVTLDALGMTGLKDESAREETARQFNCPNCGGPVAAHLATSQSITCPSCRSVIDLSQGIGAQMQHARQGEEAFSLIPLGRVGRLKRIDWQVVGFQHREGQAPGDDETFGWDEYLLYNARDGFCFLVDAEDGWSQVKPLTGAPVLTKGGRRATWQGKTYTLTDSYEARTTYVAGEFYWQVRKGQTTTNRDYALGGWLLSMEETEAEQTWSVGERIDSDSIARAFGLEDQKALLKRADASPLSQGATSPAMTLRTILIGFLLIMLVLLIIKRCNDCDPTVQTCAASSSSRSSGGSFGGFSSGGGHK